MATTDCRPEQVEADLKSEPTTRSDQAGQKLGKWPSLAEAAAVVASSGSLDGRLITPQSGVRETGAISQCSPGAAEGLQAVCMYASGVIGGRRDQDRGAAFAASKQKVKLCVENDLVDDEPRTTQSCGQILAGPRVSELEKGSDLQRVVSVSSSPCESQPQESEVDSLARVEVPCPCGEESAWFGRCAQKHCNRLICIHCRRVGYFGDFFCRGCHNGLVPHSVSRVLAVDTEAADTGPSIRDAEMMPSTPAGDGIPLVASVFPLRGSFSFRGRVRFESDSDHEEVVEEPSLSERSGEEEDEQNGEENGTGVDDDDADDVDDSGD